MLPDVDANAAPEPAVFCGTIALTLQAWIVIVLAAPTQAVQTIFPPPVIRAEGTPRPVVSPSLAPANAKDAVAQAAGFKAGKAGLKVIERCSLMGVLPLPRVTVPVAAE